LAITLTGLGITEVSPPRTSSLYGRALARVRAHRGRPAEGTPRKPWQGGPGQDPAFLSSARPNAAATAPAAPASTVRCIARMR